MDALTFKQNRAEEWLALILGHKTHHLQLRTVVALMDEVERNTRQKAVQAIRESMEKVGA